MSFLKDFKSFAMKGNVLDMAVGVVIGAAFGKIVTSLVENIIMPPIGIMVGKLDFSNLVVPLSTEATEFLKVPGNTVKMAMEKGLPLLKMGLFINTVIDFLIVALAIFFTIKLIARLMPPPPPPPPATKDCPQCAMPVPLKAVKCGHCQSAL